MPSFRSEPDKMLDIHRPAYGGLNLMDLEFEQEVNQTPYMLNVMYRNGSFSKRYGQEQYALFGSEIYALADYYDDVFVHAGTKIYKNGEEIFSGLPESKGLFMTFAQKLYYVNNNFYEYKDDTFSVIEAYLPDYMINCRPDGSFESESGTQQDDLNILNRQFKFIYNGTGDALYHVGEYDTENIIDWDVRPTIKVSDTETDDFTVDKEAKTITFTGTAPASGDANVEIIFTMLADKLTIEREQLFSCKFYETFGGGQNSRVFMGGCGYSKYYYSFAYDISYFPENNFSTLGNTEEDITGFGRQYNVLVVFKPREIYSIHSYTETTATTANEKMVGRENFRSQLVNSKVGCNAPHTIQVINNLLTWFNSNEGVCTLVSTNIQDERNVRVISRNVDRENNFGVKGILDYNEDLDTIQSADFDSKYFLVFPESGMCYVWDYEISPYRISNNGETPPSQLSWFLFNNFPARQFLRAGKKLLFSCLYNSRAFTTQLIKWVDGESRNGWSTTGSIVSARWSSQDKSVKAELGGNGGISYVSTEPDGMRIESGKTYMLTFEYKSTNGLTVRSNVGAGFQIPSRPMKTQLVRSFTANASQPNLWLSIDGMYDTIEISNIMLFEVPEKYSTADVRNAVTSYVEYGTEVLVGERNEGALISLNDTFVDLDFSNNLEEKSIKSYYMTPFLSFGSEAMLKNVKNIFVQVRGDTASVINMYYYTEESLTPEEEPESIRIGGRIWRKFQWDNFQWFSVNWANTFRRKCNLKKIQIASFFFENDEISRDLSIAYIGLQYKMVKYVR